MTRPPGDATASPTVPWSARAGARLQRILGGGCLGLAFEPFPKPVGGDGPAVWVAFTVVIAVAALVVGVCCQDDDDHSDPAPTGWGG